MSFSVGNQTQYTPREAYQRCLEGSVILDIRPEILCLYKTFDVPDVLYCPFDEIEKYLDSIPGDQEVIVGDSTGIHSRDIINLLINKGFTRTFGLAGGMVEWERDGMPVRLDNHARLSGSCMCQLKFREKK